jgi:hypothetical protein
MIAFASEYPERNLRDLDWVCALAVSERVVGYSGITIEYAHNPTDRAVVHRSMSINARTPYRKTRASAHSFSATVIIKVLTYERIAGATFCKSCLAAITN